MSERRPAFKTSPSNPAIGEIQTMPSRKADMPYAPAIRVTAPGDCCSSPARRRRRSTTGTRMTSPSTIIPVGIEAQTRLAMENIKGILAHEGLTWTDVVKVTKYLTDMRDMDGMVAAMAGYFGDWTPASTTVCVNQLSTPGARVELEMVAVYPRR